MSHFEREEPIKVSKCGLVGRHRRLMGQPRTWLPTAAVAHHLDLGQDGQGDLGRLAPPQVQADGRPHAPQLLVRETIGTLQLVLADQDQPIAADQVAHLGQEILDIFLLGRSDFKRHEGGRLFHCPFDGWHFEA
jgi:hypothetical protein